MVDDDTPEMREDELDGDAAETQNEATDSGASERSDSTVNEVDGVADEASSEAVEESADVAASNASDEAPEAVGGSDEGETGAQDIAAADSSEAPAEPTEVGPDIAEEEAIRAELGISGGKIEIDQAAIDKLLNEAIVGYEQVFSDVELSTPQAAGSAAEDTSASGGDMVAQNLGLLRDVNMRVKVELGRGRMYLKDILRLAQGSVVELERLAGDPLEIYVNEKVIARGEVLVLNENFCIRITEIYSPSELLAGVA